jgi:sugar-phosphatase
VSPGTLRPFGALLVDLDGTLADSRVPTEDAWRAWAIGAGLAEHADEIARTCHGVPSVQHVAHWAPQLDAAAEAERIEAAQVDAGADTPAFPGARELLELLPGDRVAIVTSGTPPLARGRLASAGLPMPDVAVFAGDAPQGKPYPDPYLLAAERLGVDPADCVVVEDAPAGIAAGKAAGCQVVGVAHTHSCAELEGADLCFADLNAAIARLRVFRRPQHG